MAEKTLLTGIVLVLIARIAGGQPHVEPPPYDLLPVTVRVDTMDSNVHEVRRLWSAYLSDRPNEIRSNPHWSALEQDAFHDFDHARRWIYPDVSLLQHFMPRILSIELRGDFYEIRTLYYAEGLRAAFAGSNPWALQTSYAYYEDGRWVLSSALGVRTRDWFRRRVGTITYVYSTDHHFDADLASEVAAFVEALATKYELSVPEITYYVADDADEIAWIVGLDYTLGPTEGRAYFEDALLLSGTGREHYPHELVHLVFRDYRSHSILEEGIATLYGGAGGLSPNEIVGKLALYLDANPEVELSFLLENQFVDGTNAHFYAAGAVLVRMANE